MNSDEETRRLADLHARLPGWWVRRSINRISSRVSPGTADQADVESIAWDAFYSACQNWREGGGSKFAHYYATIADRRLHEQLSLMKRRRALFRASPMEDAFVPSRSRDPLREIINNEEIEIVRQVSSTWHNPVAMSRAMQYFDGKTKFSGISKQGAYSSIANLLRAWYPVLLRMGFSGAFARKTYEPSPGEQFSLRLSRKKKTWRYMTVSGSPSRYYTSEW